jgi:hypothetical protein
MHTDNKIKVYLPIAVLLFFIPTLFMSSCTVNYSFTGADIPAEAKTVSIAYFSPKGRDATSVNPRASDLFTDRLTALMLTQTNLDVISENGDLQFSGNIVLYTNTPVAAQSDTESSARNRITMGVVVTYINSIEPDKSFEDRLFTQFADFDANENLTDVEIVLIEEINEAITQDIFNSSFGAW